MSKITLAPNASGTGTLTIAAPNTNTDRTLTLPDSTGTVLTSAGGTITGNLTLSSGLSVTGKVYGQQYHGDGTDELSILSNNASQGINFYTGVGGVSAVSRMRIDSAGRVTMPYQPAFRGYTNPDQTTAGEVTANWVVQYDRGSNFSGGRFTAPVTGVYFFSVAIDAMGSPSRVALRKNGSTFAMNEPTITNDGWETINITSDINMTAGDYVSIHFDNGSGPHPFHMGGGYWGWFCGHLIG